jgi:hypothetical protein
MISGPGFATGYVPPARDYTVRQRQPVPVDNEVAESRKNARNAELTRDLQSVTSDEGFADSSDSGLQASQKVSSALNVDQSRFRRQQEVDELPLRSQKALAAYSSNQQPYSQERTTSELVGVDIFV